MEVKQIQRKSKILQPGEKYEMIVENETCCPLCGTELQFVHRVDHLGLCVQEEAHCPSCRIRTKSQTQTLH